MQYKSIDMKEIDTSIIDIKLYFKIIYVQFKFTYLYER